MTSPSGDRSLPRERELLWGVSCCLDGPEAVPTAMSGPRPDAEGERVWGRPQTEVGPSLLHLENALPHPPRGTGCARLPASPDSSQRNQPLQPPVSPGPLFFM